MGVEVTGEKNKKIFKQDREINPSRTVITINGNKLNLMILR